MYLALNVVDNVQVLNIVIEGDLASPEELNNLSLPDNIDWAKGVIINGRAPIWAYVYVAHLCHPASWVAVASPRDGGAIVVERHTSRAPQVGTIIPMS